MPKSDIDKKAGIKITKSTTNKELDKIKDPKVRIEAYKRRNELRDRASIVSAEKIEKEKQIDAPKIGGVKVKVRPNSSQSSETKTSGSTKSTSYQEKKNQAEKLKQYREQLAVLTTLANQRVQQIAESGVTSRALDAAIASRPESRNPDDDLFVANLRTEKQIKNELSRVMTFLSDPTSLSEGAERFTGNLTAAGLFGAQYRKDGGPGYNTDYVSQEVGEAVFGIYHRVLEVNGGWERVMGYFKANSGGLIEYGSENLINAIYDMVTQMGTDEETQGKIIARATDMIESMVSSYEEMATMQRSGVDYGLIGYDETAEDRRHNWQWQMQRKGLL